MFSLHETTQRRVCRTAFVAGCVLPTICVIFWTAYLNRPWRESDWQQTLREQLHVQATVGQVSSPRPGITQLKEVQIADLRTGRQLGTITDLRYERWSSSLIADRIEIAADQLPEFATSLATWISSGELTALELQAASVRFIGPNGEAAELKNARLKSSESSDSGKLIDLQATPTNATEGGTVQLRVRQPAGETEPKIVMQFNTQGERLPAWLLADFVPGMQGCASAQFIGQLHIETFSETVHGRMSGTVEGIELEQWIDFAGNHQLKAQANIHFEAMQWRDNRIQRVQGHLESGTGSVSRSLVKQSVERLFCVPSELLKTTFSRPTDEPISFDELGFGFRIDERGLSISGDCNSIEGAEGSESLLVKDGQPLLLQPRPPVFPVAQLIQSLLLPESSVSWLPATLEANAMGEVLPLPSTSPGPRGGPAVRADEKSE